MNLLRLLLLSLFLLAFPGTLTLPAQEPHPVKAIVDRCMVTITEPVKLKEAAGFETLDLCAALGNGNLMLTLTGGPDTITIPVGKNHGKPARYIRLEVTKMRKTRYFGKYAAQLAEIEVRRQE